MEGFSRQHQTSSKGIHNLFKALKINETCRVSEECDIEPAAAMGNSMTTWVSSLNVFNLKTNDIL